MALSFTTISQDGRHSFAGTNSGFNSELDEEEIDQLDSGLDDDEDDMEPEVEEEESISTAKGRRRLGVRIPGHTLVPQDRLDMILQAEGAGPHMSKEAVYMLSIATEEFVKKLAESGFQQTVSENRQHVQYRDIANVAQRRPAFKFLEDTIPKPISIAEAMQLRAAKGRELVDGDPAISAALPSSPPFLPQSGGSIPVSISAKARAKSRQSLPVPMNGRETNGSASASVSAASTPAPSGSISAAPSRARHRDSRGRWRNGPANHGSHEGTPSSTASGTREDSARIRVRPPRVRGSPEVPSHAYPNGEPATQNGRAISSASVPQDAAAEQRAQGQVIGPASGYLDDGNRLLLNGRNSMTDNPGRTIYSQQRPSAQPH